MGPKISYVYALLDPRYEYKRRIRYGDFLFKHPPFYIGKGIGKRAFSHVSGVSKGKYTYNVHKEGIIKKSLSLGFEIPVAFLYESLTDKQAQKLEILMIRTIGRANLTNQTSGGDGWRNPSAESRAKISKALTGRPVSEATRRKMSESNSGKKHSEATRRKISLAKFNPSEETRARISASGIGHVLSPEALARRNESIRKSRTPELRARISAALIGRRKPPRTLEYRRNMSIAKSNISEETREKMRAARLGKQLSPDGHFI